MDTRTRRRGIVGPLLLVAVGALFLLSNLGYLGWDAWSLIFRFWPILLIALGLELLIGRRSLVGSLAVVVIVIALIAGFMLVSPATRTSERPLVSENISQSLQGAKRAAVELSFGAGTLHVGSLSDPDLLIQGTTGTYGANQLTRSFQLSGDTANYRLGVRQGNPGPFMPMMDGRGAWDLRLNGTVPMTLTVNGGVGTSDLDLSQLHVTRIDANLGVGKTTIAFPSAGQVQGRINGGVGEVVLVIPSGVGSRFEVDAGLGGLNLPPGYEKQGNAYVSSNYATAESRVDLAVKGGIGKVSIQQ